MMAGRDPLLSHPTTAGAPTHTAASTQQLELRLQQTVGELDATKRSAQAVRVRFEADLQVARARIQQLQDALAANLETTEELGATNAELSTAFDATQWRLGVLEADTTAHQQALLHMQQERDVAHHRVEELEQATAAAVAQHGELERRLQELAAERHAADTREVALQREELDRVRGALAEAAAAAAAERAKSHELEEQIQQHAVELEAAATLAKQHAAVLAAAEQREADQRRHCEGLDQQLEEIQKQAAATMHRRDATAGQLVELQNERGALAMRIDELTALNGQLDRESERLRRDRGSGEETRRLKSENARLEAKIIELDRQRSEAVQRHSAAVAGYMVELNQRSEALHAREVELQKLTQELTIIKQNCEDATSELVAQRQTQGALERQLAEVRVPAAAAAAPPVAEPTRAAPPPRPTAPPQTRMTAAKPAKRSARGDAMNGPITVIHLDENEAFRQAAREVVGRLPDARYVNAPDPAVPNAAGSRLLAVNLLSRTHDPLEAITSFIAADTYHQNVLAYCAEGASGFSFGMADFFAPPIDPDACVARLMESRGAIQRLLVVTENFNVVGALREVLSRMRSSVSAALDLRQVIDLLPMVAPDVVLIDLALPRGDGLRLVSRLRSDPKTRELPLGILLAPPSNSAELRQHALRAARDSSMSAAELTAVLTSRLGAPPPAAAPERLRPSANARA